MSIRFQILGSSSAGNAALLCSPESKVLIDAGFSGRKLETLLQEVGESLDAIDAVFFTHEHGDHSAGLRGLSRNPRIQFFANRDTAQVLQERLNRPINWQLFETGSTFTFKDLEVSAFSTPHDAYDPVGFTFVYEGVDMIFPTKRSLAWVTDLGYIPKLVEEKIRQVEILVLESNYDPKMLDQDSQRPWSLKQRIKGRHGHLSNDKAFEFIANTPNAQWKQIYLAHLSRDCNNVERVKEVFEPLLQPGMPFDIEIVDPHKTSVLTPELV